MSFERIWKEKLDNYHREMVRDLLTLYKRTGDIDYAKQIIDIIRNFSDEDVSVSDIDRAL